ncbi:YybH family protein [Rhizobium leguminosarum]
MLRSNLSICVAVAVVTTLLVSEAVQARQDVDQLEVSAVSIRSGMSDEASRWSATNEKNSWSFNLNPRRAGNLRQISLAEVYGQAAVVLREPGLKQSPAKPQELLAEYERSLAEHSFDAVESLISADAVFWFNDGSYSGHSAIRSAFEATFAAFPLERYWLENVEWIALSETSAACIYQFRWKATTSAGEVFGGGRGTTVMRIENGSWKIVHMHLSQEPK